MGESLIDIVHSEGDVSSLAPGGSPLNVAVTLGRLGLRSQLWTAIGDDGYGRIIQAHLEGSEVAFLGDPHCLDRTSTASAHVRSDGSATYSFAIEWAPSDQVVGAPDAMHAGSLALFLDPGADAVLDRLGSASEATLVSIDPNVRPSLLENHERAVERFERAAIHANVVKLSDEDAVWLYPDLTSAAVLEHLLELGATLAVLTKGPAGSVLACGGDRVEVPALPVVVKDTIGAGDAFMGGLIHQLLVRDLASALLAGEPLWPEELAEIGHAASKVSAFTVARLGADPPWSAEMDAFAGTR